MPAIRAVLVLSCAVEACAHSPERPLDAAMLNGGLDAAYPADGGALDGGMDGDTEPASDAAPDAASCADEGPSSSACRYLSSDGTAVITQIGPAPSTTNRCDRDPVTVSFDFEPDDPASRRCAKDDQSSVDSRWTFTVGDGKAPPRSCIEGAGIVVGSRLRVRRRDIVAGTCTPVLFVFDNQLVTSCQAQCFP